jgi:hypothetical protein
MELLNIFEAKDYEFTTHDIKHKLSLHFGNTIIEIPKNIKISYKEVHLGKTKGNCNNYVLVFRDDHLEFKMNGKPSILKIHLEKDKLVSVCNLLLIWEIDHMLCSWWIHKNNIDFAKTEIDKKFTHFIDKSIVHIEDKDTEKMIFKYYDNIHKTKMEMNAYKTDLN